MQVLLPPECIKIQPIKITNESHDDESAEANRDKPEEKAEKQHKESNAAEPHAEPYAESKEVEAEHDESTRPEGEEDDSPTLPNQVKETNRNDVLFTEIREYLTNPADHDRPADVYLHGSRAANGLLPKDSKLWVTKGLRLDVIQEVHD